MLLPFLFVARSKADAADHGFTTFDPRARRNSSPAQVGGATQRTIVADSRPGGERPRGLTIDTDIITGISGGRSAAGQRQDRRLGLSERKRRRRKRQQRSRQKKPPRCSDFLDNGDDIDVNSDGLDDAETRIASTQKNSLMAGPPELSGETGDGSEHNAAARHNRGRSTMATHPDLGKAQQKIPGAERGGKVGNNGHKVMFKPVAETPCNARRKRAGSAVDISGSRTEEKPRRQREVSEYLQIGGGVEDEKGKWLESRAAAAAESRLRRSQRRSKSQESKKRGDDAVTLAAPEPKDRAPAEVKTVSRYCCLFLEN